MELRTPPWSIPRSTTTPAQGLTIGFFDGRQSFTAILDQGPITLDSVSIAEFAPEPGALLLAACGVTAVAAWAVRGRTHRRKSFPESSL